MILHYIENRVQASAPALVTKENLLHQPAHGPAKSGLGDEKKTI